MAHRSTPVGSDPSLPSRIPLFPLGGALLLPGGELPLNIFEPRYIAMTDWAMRTDRLIGMIQPQQNGELYAVGCVGRITDYRETDDNRYLITLRGISRFHLQAQPHLTADNYFLAEVDWSSFTHDMQPAVEPPADLCRSRKRDLLERFLHQADLSIDWEQAGCLTDAKFYTLLSMVVPLGVAEKQALLEAADVPARCQMLMQMMEIALAEHAADKPQLLH
jgi:Lon protease-like protein